MIYEIWIANQINGTKLALEASRDSEEIYEWLRELLPRIEVGEVGIRKFKEDGD